MCGCGYVVAVMQTGVVVVSVRLSVRYVCVRVCVYVCIVHAIIHLPRAYPASSCLLLCCCRATTPAILIFFLCHLHPACAFAVSLCGCLCVCLHLHRVSSFALSLPLADRDHFGRIFYNQANMSAMGIPQVLFSLSGCVTRVCVSLCPCMLGWLFSLCKIGTLFALTPSRVHAVACSVLSVPGGRGYGLLHCRR